MLRTCQRNNSLLHRIAIIDETYSKTSVLPKQCSDYFLHSWKRKKKMHFCADRQHLEV